MNTAPASQPITVLELISTALKATSSQDLPAEGRRALAEGVINSQVEDPGQREILLKLAVESAATREDLVAVYQRLGVDVDPKGLLRMPTRFERSQAESVFQAINLAAADVGLAPHPYFEGALKLVTLDTGDPLVGKLRDTDFKGHHAGSRNDVWRRIEMQLFGRIPETDGDRAPVKGPSLVPIFDIQYVKASPVEPVWNGPRDPMVFETATGSGEAWKGTTHIGAFASDDRPTSEQFISQVRAAPARFGVASLDAFDTFVGLYRSTNEVTTTKALVSLIGALEVALDVKLDQKGARALKEAFNAEPRMPLDALITKFAFFTPTENKPADYHRFPGS